MRNRFWVGTIICLLAAFFILTLMSHAAGCDESECDEGVCAGARISGSTELTAKGTVSAPRNCWGGWGINVRAGNKRKGPSGYYTKGVRKSAKVEDYTSQARATSWITGYNRHDESYYANACDESGG